MKISRYKVLALAVAAASTGSMAQGSRSYRADANSTKSVELTLCNRIVDVRVRGDTDTDLDFTIRDNSGRIVHSDIDGTDWTTATLRPNISAGNCAAYTLQVRNLGDVYNNFAVTLTDRAPALAAARGTDGRNRYISIHNHTAEAFSRLHWSNTADGDWGSNKIGSTVLRARTNRSINIDDGTGACRFDFKVRTSSGREYTRRNINVCTASTVEFGTEVTH